ncbi:MAG: transglycosylase domain-containing protein [Deltaproteobacteria bacterium]|nr:transglycosylase domain-containing protein [Deltaproteobacteria bacterium]
MGRISSMFRALRRLVSLGGTAIWDAAVAVTLTLLIGISLLALAVEGLTTYLSAYLGPALYEQIADKIHPNYSMQLTSREGYTIATAGKDDSRREPIVDLPDTFRDLLVSFEDARFDAHNGVDRVRLLGAFLQTIRGQLEGGSTLTMQLAKMIKGDSARTLRRKLDDMALALEIEKHHSKDEIIKLYADHAYFGHNVYGLANACQYYFARKHCHGLTLAEAAYLVGLVKAPSKYANDYHQGLSRRDMVLFVALGPDTPGPDVSFEGFARWFAKRGWRELIDREVLGRDRAADAYGRLNIAKALDTPLTMSRQHEIVTTPFVRDAAMSLVEDRLGSEQMVRGARVELTLSTQAQAIAEMALHEAFGEAERDRDPKKDHGAPIDGGVVVLDAKSGDVLALIGGRDYAESQVPFALRPIQVGSAIKPFVYALGFQQGVLKRGKNVVDQRVCIDGWCPKNYGNKYNGSLPVEDALARSLNSVAVRTAQAVTVPELYLKLRELGITSLLEQNLTLALGASEVSMLELAQAYTALLDGQVKSARLLTRAKTRQGKLLYDEPESEAVQVFDTDVAESVRAGMKKALQPGGTAIRLGTQLQEGWKTANIDVPPEVACKTGTTNESSRVGMVCVVSDSDIGKPLIVAIYLGHRVPKPLGEQATGGRLAGPAMRRIIAQLSVGQKRYKSFAEQSPKGPQSQEAQRPALIAETDARKGGDVVRVVEADGQDWLHTLYRMGVTREAFQSAEVALNVRDERLEQFNELLRGDEWQQGNGASRALSLMSKLVRFVRVRGLDARESARTFVVREPGGFSVVQEQPDRTVTERLRARTDLTNVRVRLVRRDAGERIAALELTKTDGTSEAWLWQNGRLRQAVAVDVTVSQGAFAQAWSAYGLGPRQYADLRAMTAGLGIDFERIHRGFGVSLLMMGHQIVAARVGVPDNQGAKRFYEVVRLSDGVYDQNGKRVAQAIWPLDAIDVETFQAQGPKGKPAAITTLLLHAIADTPVVSPTRARVTSVNPIAREITLQSAAGHAFSLRGVDPFVTSGDYVSGGQILGYVDERGALQVRSDVAIERLITHRFDQGSAVAKRRVTERVSSLDFLLAPSGLPTSVASTKSATSTFGVR